MPKCKNDPKRSYKGTEPSPKGFGYCAHAETISKKRKGTDGNTWIIKQVKNGSKRWMKYKISDKVKIIKKNKKENSNKKINCKKFVVYTKEEKGFFGIGAKTKKLMGIMGDNNTIYKYISYNKFEKNTTDIPDGFRKKSLKKSFISKYYCGSKIYLKKNNEAFNKIKKEMKGFKSYLTHWNGGRPYLVYIKRNDVHIYKCPKYNNIDEIIDMKDYNNDDNKNKWIYIEFVKKYKAKKVFIGFDSCKYDGSDLRKGDKKWSMGNTILLQMTKNKYVLIDSEVSEFITKDEIIRFFAQIGRNDVPYPIALSKDNVYFMLDYVYTPRVLFPKNIKESEFENVYSIYYGHEDDKYENLSKILVKNKKKFKKKIIDTIW